MPPDGRILPEAMQLKSQSILPWHAAFLERALHRLQADSRIVGVAAAGSFAGGTMDEFSDLDLVIAIEPGAVVDVMRERRLIAAGLGTLVAAFTGEHVGEPRLLICLYGGEAGAAPLHVDLKFVSLPDAAVRVDEPVVLFEHEGRLSQVLLTGEARYPAPDLSWIEDRFWVWIHYAAVKIGRGELFEAADFLAFLRAQVIGPLILVEAGGQPSGVRRVETMAPLRAAQLEATVAAYDRSSCIRSVYAAVDLYRSLRNEIGAGKFVANEAAERVAMEYLANIAGIQSYT
jgi:predicted nucleotidyltransferase